MCQAKHLWDDVTTMCRGLITTDSGEIVGRSFPKFFNLGEGMHTPTDDFTVHEKLDGSLGILFFYADKWIVSSRGSFVSPQAYRAQQMLRTKYNIDGLDKDTSYVFEIIYPDNRIVLDYGQMEELVFLAAFNRNGEEVFPPDKALIERCGFPLCRSFPEFTDYNSLSKLNWQGKEGFVVRFSSGDRMKIKFENYLALHRIATNISTKTVFDWFSQKKSLVELLETVPDEFHAWVISAWDTFQVNYDKVLVDLLQTVSELENLSQKEFALAVSTHKYKHMLFILRAKKDVFSAICKEIEPGTDDIVNVWSRAPQMIPTLALANENPRPTLTFMIGVSGSGKTTFAKTLCQEQDKCVIISRDHLRQHLFSYNDETMQDYHSSTAFGDRELLVTKVQRAQIEAALGAGYSVIIDDTNLRARFIRELTSYFNGYDHKYELLECTLEEACERQALRTRKVGAAVIEQQLKRLELLRPLLPELFNTKQMTPIVQNPGLPRCIVVDMDGTLALVDGLRNPYDWSKCAADPVNKPVRDAVLAMHSAGHEIVICSGRDNKAKTLTATWLSEHNIPYKALYMRKENDTRPDYIIKHEMWQDITNQYYIVTMFDDRSSVVSHARNAGFTVFQVSKGDF